MGVVLKEETLLCSCRRCGEVISTSYVDESQVFSLKSLRLSKAVDETRRDRSLKKLIFMAVAGKNKILCFVFLVGEKADFSGQIKRPPDF